MRLAHLIALLLAPWASTTTAADKQPPIEPVPILVYHHIAAPPTPARNRALWVSPTLFDGQVTALAQAGYHGMSLDEVWLYWKLRRQLPARPVVFSFDDGYSSQYRAANVLRRFGWPGVLNLALRFLDRPGGIKRTQVRALLHEGWELDAHSRTHPDLTKLTPVRLRAEVAGSRGAINTRFGASANFFCYPYGRYNPAVERAVRAAGFAGATTTMPGLAAPRPDPYAMKRISVTAHDSPARLARRIRQTTERRPRQLGRRQPPRQGAR
jgi:peptidoglycan/xylan/chitin deacetylase (PgdA/CDA1 family)